MAATGSSRCASAAGWGRPGSLRDITISNQQLSIWNSRIASKVCTHSQFLIPNSSLQILYYMKGAIMSSTTMDTAALLRGGEWLLQASDPAGVFTPERLTEEHRLIGQTVTDFVEKEVLPVLDRLEQKDWALARRLVQRCGELGLLGVDVAEAYGGVQLDKVTSMIVSEKMSRSASFGGTFGAHANLVILPMSLFASDPQTSKYL